MSTRSDVRAVLLAALRGHADVVADDVFSGRQPPANYADQAWVVRDRPKTVLEKANNLVLRGYPFEVEFRATVTDDDGDEQAALVDAALALLEGLFDFKVVSDFPGLPDLERVRVQELSTDERSGGEDADDEIRARALVTFSMWEAP